MRSQTEQKLNEFFLGIIVYAKASNPNYFGAGDFAILASSTINYLQNKQEVKESERKECANYMCNLFIEVVGTSMNSSLHNTIIDLIVNTKTIDPKFSIIIASMEYSR